MDRADARRWGGAKSAARGMSTWGTTDKIPMRNSSTSKVTTDRVSGRPIDSEEVPMVRSNTNCRRGTRSPRGEMKSRPTAYLQHENVSEEES